MLHQRARGENEIDPVVDNVARERGVKFRSLRTEFQHIAEDRNAPRRRQAADKRQGAWRDSAAELEDIVLAAVRAGDLVIVKGSNASRMSAIVAALKTRFSAGNGDR